MKTRFNTYVAVFFNDGNLMYPRFVTDTEGNTALWEDGKEAKRFSESYAKDIVYGLTINGFPSAVVKVPYGVILRNTKTNKEE